MKILEKAIHRHARQQIDTVQNSTTEENWWELVQAFFFNAFKSFGAILLLVLVIYAIIELFRYDMVIEAFETPFNLAREQGYTGTVVAHRLQTYMTEIRHKLKTPSIPATEGVAAIQFAELTQPPEIDVPSIGLSLNTIIAQLKKMLGVKHRRVSGDIVIRDNKMYLTLRITSQPVFRVLSDNVTNPEPLIRRAAQHILDVFEPLTVGLNYCVNGKNSSLNSLIKENRHYQVSNADKAIGLMLEGCLLKNQQEYERAIKKLVQAEQLDRKNPVISHITGDTLVKQGKPSQAINEYKKALKYAPTYGGIQTQWARALVALGNTNEALAKYEQAAENDPDNYWIYLDWAIQLAELKRVDEAENKLALAQQINPSYALTYATWGNVLLNKRNNHKEASDKYAMALELNGNLAWVYGNWGQALLKQDKDKEAIVQFEKAVNLGGGTAATYGNWGLALVKLGKYEEAIVQYQKAARKNTGESWIYKGWGDALFMLKQYEQAMLQYETAMKLNPDDWYPYYLTGKSLTELKRYEEAISQYKEALKYNETHVWSRIKLGHALISANKLEDALAQCETLLKSKLVSDKKSKAGVQALCGLVNLGLEQPQKALERCEIAIGLNQDDALVYQCLENALLKINEPDAFAKYETFVEKSTNENIKGHYYYSYALALAKDKRYQDAIIQYQKAAEFNLNEASFYGNWGNALLQSDDYEKAIVQYQTAQKLESNIYWIYANWGIALGKLKQFEAAISKYQKALEVEPIAWVYYKLGETLVQLKQHEQGIVQYNKALELEPSKRLYHYAWGKALSELGKFEEAITQYQKGLEIEPTHVWSHIWLGYALIKVKKFEEALTQCEDILKSTPTLATVEGAAQALCGLALVGLEQPKVALEKCQTALQVYEKEDWAYWCLGNAQIALKKPAEAAEQYEAAVKLKPNKAFYYLKWGQALVELKQNEAAITQYEKAVELDNDGSIGKQAQAHIEQLKAEQLKAE